MTDEMKNLCATVIDDATNSIIKTIHDAGGDPEDAVSALIATIATVISLLCDDKETMHLLLDETISPKVHDCIDSICTETLN